MKLYFAAVALLATVSATAGLDCSSDSKACLTTECCGTGYRDYSKAGNEATNELTICNDAFKTTYESQDGLKKYTFRCNQSSNQSFVITGAGNIGPSVAAGVALIVYHTMY